MKLVFQISSNRIAEISAEGDRLTRGEIKTLKEYLDIQERLTPPPAEMLPTPSAEEMLPTVLVADNNAGINPDQAQRLEAQYRTFLERHPGFLVDCAYRFTCLWHDGATYRTIIREFPGVTNTDVGAIRFGLNLPRRRDNYDIKTPEERINHVRKDATWPGRAPVCL